MDAILPDDTRTLPDGTPIPHTALFRNGYVLDWTGRRCKRCGGSGEHVHPFDRAERYSCQGCGGTTEEHGPTYRWEE
jgi:hypothetical protein